jgi:predicted nucleotidyltransferase
MERALVQTVGTVPVRVASLDDMLLLKQNTGRRQDIDDVEHLLRLKAEMP